jgi:hypothetical protein
VGAVRCPRCRQFSGRRSPRSGAIERALSALFVYPFRCQLCGRRFRALQWGARYARMDRRHFERQTVRLSATVISREGMAEGEVTDLSLAGCGVKVELRPVTGDQVTLRLRLTRDTRPLEITAAVRSVHIGALGLAFTAMGALEQQRLRHFLDAHVTDAGPETTGRRGAAWRGQPLASSAAVWVVTLVVLLGAVLVVRLWPTFRVCVWGESC